MSLKPYDKKAACPKCGCKKVGTVYDSGGDVNGHGCYMNSEAVYVAKEHFDRTCANCHFSWHEACLPKKGKKE